MSFGYAVGDVFAIINLLERVAQEVRNYRDAPRHFQNLGIELHLLYEALQRVLDVQACDDGEAKQLDQIKAIAMHCQQPLLAFMEKMRPSETSLGPMRSTSTLSTIGKRLHWSLVTRKDVDELRQVIVSEMAAINMLMAVQQLDLLKEFTSTQQDSSSTNEIHEFCSTSREYFTNSMTILQESGKTPIALEQLQDLVSEKLSRQEEAADQTNEHVSRVAAALSALTVRTKSASIVIRRTGDKMLNVVRTVTAIAEDIGKMILTLVTLSKVITEKIAAQG